MFVGIHETQIVPQPTPGTVFRNGANVDTLALVLRGGTIAQNESHWLKYLAAAESRLCPPGHEHPFISVVVKNAAKFRHVLTTKRQRHRFRNGVADRVGMPLRLALDQLDALLFEGARVSCSSMTPFMVNQSQRWSMSSRWLKIVPDRPR